MHEIIREGNLPACAYNLKKLMKFVKADVETNGYSHYQFYPIFGLYLAL